MVLADETDERSDLTDPNYGTATQPAEIRTRSRQRLAIKTESTPTSPS